LEAHSHMLEARHSHMLEAHSHIHPPQGMHSFAYRWEKRGACTFEGASVQGQ
jgi:hypothetical protein